MGEHALELRRFLLQLQLTRLGLFRHAVQPALDVVAIGDEQLEPKCLEIVRRDARAREAVQHDEERVHLTQVAEQLRTGAAHLDDADRRRRDLARPDHLGDAREAWIGNRRHADIPGCTRTCQRVEQRRLPGARKPHDPDLERHL